MKRLIITALIGAAISLQTSARNGFAIVVDPASYKEAKTEIEAYAQAIEQVNHWKVFTVVDQWGIPDSIRARLISLHRQKQTPLAGCVLMGDIPVAMVRDGQHMTSAFKMDQRTERKQSSVPSDRFYDDFGLQFRFIDKEQSAPYFYYSVLPGSQQRIRPDIFSGRIRPTDAGGTSRYDKLRSFLRKATAEKMRKRPLQQLFYFSGHGYISESKVARIDEKASYLEHFPTLKGRTNAIGHMDHSDQNPIKERLMNELMRTDLDLAILHHHGYWDTQYLNGTIRPYTVRAAKEYIIGNIRKHIYEAKQRGKNYDSLRVALQEKFDVPETWTANVLSDSLTRLDSVADAAADLHLEDFGFYGYRPNVPMVIIDACFCGSFHLDNCIANEYIFQPGGTVAVLANSVNALQDKWSDRFIGLVAEGGCAGDLVKYAGYLESHVIGDPTFGYAPPTKAIDLHSIAAKNKPAGWRRLLKSGTPDQQAIAIEQLYRLGAITSGELLALYEASPYGIVRLQALLTIANYRDSHFVKAVELASHDSYELAQRIAIKLMAQSGDERLIPPLIRIAITNNTSERCNFNAMMALSSYPKDKLQSEFARQYDAPSVQYIRKDSVRSIILNAIAHSADRLAPDIDSLASKTTTDKQRRFTIRAMRNTMVHYKIPVLLDYLQHCNNEETQVMLLECLGWHPYSYQAEAIASTALKISGDAAYPQAVRDEALKTYNRIHAK
jgi:hypothetical protein